MRYFSFLFILAVSGLAYGQNDNVRGLFDKPRVLRFGVTFEPHLGEDPRILLSNALTIVSTIHADEYKFENVGEGPFDFLIEITDRPTLLAKIQNSNSRIFKFANEINGDAFSAINPDRPGTPIVVFVLWDEAMYLTTSTGKRERHDAFTRLVTLLGHEIYGNVAYFMRTKKKFQSVRFRNSAMARNQEWIRSEVNAFAAGVRFIETMISKYGDRIGWKFTQDLNAALEREKAQYEVFKERLKVLQSGEVIPLTVCDKLIE